jgi:hypothetical protein
VDGIPARFVIDKNGKIRLKNIGFTGSAEKLFEEVSPMAEMLR